MQNVPNEYRLITIVTLAVLLTGMIVYHFVEHLSWLDAIYFSVITLATVGYGDIVPHTVVGKIFTIFYVFIGIGIFAAFARTLVERANKRRLERLKNKEENS